jgi:cobalt-precorrin-5B (C1)-methyltransferase
MAEIPAPAVGYTLPVWLAAAARAALLRLLNKPFTTPQQLLLDPLAMAQGAPTAVPAEAAALLPGGIALGVARCDPGPGVLDLTRGLAVWVQLRWLDGPGPWLELQAGEGVGVIEATGQPCLSGFARQLLEANLQPLLPEGRRLELTAVIPEGRRLAERTSNAAFGVVEGLALIGTQAEVQRSAAPEQLDLALAALRERASDPVFGGDLVLVIGENGLDLAPQLGLPRALLLKTGNWLGPLLVAAAEARVRRLLLFGYQGKLIKLAGGIFHTHHHLADGRLEVLTTQAALLGLPLEQLQQLATAASVDEGLRALAAVDAAAAQALQHQVATAVEQRSAVYLARHGDRAMRIGAVLFDRSRRLCAEGPSGADLFQAFRARDLG